MLHGRIYDRNALQNWLDASPNGSAKDPIDNSVFTAKDIITPWAIRDQIQQNIELIKEGKRKSPAEPEPELEDSGNKKQKRAHNA